MFWKLFINVFAIYMSIAHLYTGLHTLVADLFGEGNAYWSAPIFFALMILMSWCIWQINIDLFLEKLYK